MKLDYVHDTTANGRYRNVVSENLVRLTHFDKEELHRLADVVAYYLIEKNESVDLLALDFIQPVNCNLRLMFDITNKGILKTNIPGHFVCLLNREGYSDMVEMLRLLGDGYNWLCDTSDDNIDFLVSRGGRW